VVGEGVLVSVTSVGETVGVFDGGTGVRLGVTGVDDGGVVNVTVGGGEVSVRVGV
jgi:hypothetical protein